jgi:hypothetical protein
LRILSRGLALVVTRREDFGVIKKSDQGVTQKDEKGEEKR